MTNRFPQRSRNVKNGVTYLWCKFSPGCSSQWCNRYVQRSAQRSMEDILVECAHWMGLAWKRLIHELHAPTGTLTHTNIYWNKTYFLRQKVCSSIHDLVLQRGLRSLDGKLERFVTKKMKKVIAKLEYDRLYSNGYFRKTCNGNDFS